MDSNLQPRLTQEPVLLDLIREPVDEMVFKSYTYTGTLFKKPNLFIFLHFSLHPFLVSFSTLAGITSPVLSFRSFSLKPESRYMLEVAASEFYNNSVVEFLHQSKSNSAVFSLWIVLDLFEINHLYFWSFSATFRAQWYSSGTDSTFLQNKSCSRRNYVPGSTSHRTRVVHTL